MVTLHILPGKAFEAVRSDLDGAPAEPRATLLAQPLVRIDFSPPAKRCAS